MLYLAFLKPSLRNWNDLLVHLAICVRTHGPYAHNELVFTDDHQLPGIDSLCFSATAKEGVRFNHRDFTPSYWDIVPLKVTKQQDAYIRLLANEIDKSSYGFDDVWRFFFPVQDDINTYSCSNTDATLLARAGVIPVPERECWKMTPTQLHSAACELIAARSPT